MRNTLLHAPWTYCRRTLSILLVTLSVLLPPRAGAQQDEKDIVIAEQKATIERLKKEVEALRDVVKEREVLIVKLEADVKKHRIESTTLTLTVETLKSRNEMLLEMVRALTLEKGGKEGVRVINPNEPNPPAAQIDGKIEKIEGDLVQVNLGIDHGLNKSHTLEVYRLQPQPKYLGMIRIIDVKNETAVGRIVASGNATARPELKVGDLVGSRIPKK